MSDDSGLTYRDAGVDIDAGDAMVRMIAGAVRKTWGPRVIGDFGGYAGLFRLDYRENLLRRDYNKPLLVACTDSVGSKVLLAIETGRLDTVGIDAVAMNVNDLICTGAEPLFCLDYIATHTLDAEAMARIVKGFSDGCHQAGCALLGGETAEIPDLYAPGHFDLVGFAVGVVEQNRLIDGSHVRAGDVLIGLPSSGLHSNGFALARRALLGRGGYKLDQTVDELGGTLAEELLRPTTVYVKTLQSLLGRYRRKRVVTAIAHVTGGGIEGNLPRVLPKGCAARIDRGSWAVPPIFDLIERAGVKRTEMMRVFNMGLGMILTVRPNFLGSVLDQLAKEQTNPCVIGRIVRGRGGVQFR